MAKVFFDPIPPHESATDPHTGYRLESADHTHLSTGAQGGTLTPAALAADTGYTQFTPTVTQSGAVVSFTTNQCWYKQVGKFVHVYGYLAINDAGTATASNAITISLPVNALYRGSLAFVIGSGMIYDTSTDDIFAGMARLASASTFSLMPTAADITTTAGGVYLGVFGGFVAALATGDFLLFNLEYESV